MKITFKKIKDWWNRNPYDEAYNKAMSLQYRNPDTPQLAKLAYYCGCEVEDIIAELKKQLENDNNAL